MKGKQLTQTQLTFYFSAIPSVITFIVYNYILVPSYF